MSVARKSRNTLQPAVTLHANGARLEFYVGDCVDVLRGLPDAAVSAVVTSPPYNLGVDYRTYRDTLSRDALANPEALRPFEELARSAEWAR